MKRKIIRLAEVLLNMIFSVMKLLPVQNKITYISRQSREVPYDFRLVVQMMEKQHPEYKNVVLVKMIDPGIAAKIKYGFHMLVQMYHIATSRMVVLDTYCIAVSFLKQRESLIVIQMWHAMGSLKKFGKSILDKGEGSKRELAEAMKMHRNYSYVFCSSNESKEAFAEAFGVTLDQMVVMPLPRLDLLRNASYIERVKKKIYQKYPVLNNTEKTILVYAPTFRKDETELKKEAQALAEAIDKEKYQLIVKLHPLSETVIDCPGVIQDHSFSTVDICQLADIVIMDYSAVMFEIMTLKKPICFFAFDYDTYTQKRDFYVDYREKMPGKISANLQELLENIKSIDLDTKVDYVGRNMIEENDGESYTEAVVSFLIEKLKTG